MTISNFSSLLPLQHTTVAFFPIGYQRCYCFNLKKVRVEYMSFVTHLTNLKDALSERKR